MDDVANYQRACESAQTMVQDYLTGYPPFMDEDAAIPLVPCNTDGAPLVADVPFEYVELRMPNGANLKFGLRLGNDPRKCTRRAASCAYCGASCKGITCSNRCNAKRTNASRATPLGGDQSAHQAGHCREYRAQAACGATSAGGAGVGGMKGFDAERERDLNIHDYQCAEGRS